MGTMNGVYSRMDAADQAAARESKPEGTVPSFNIWHSLAAAVATIPANAEAFAHGFFDPLGFGEVEQAQTSNLQQVAEQQNLDRTTLSRMASLFSVPAAIAYLIFVLLYIPCVSTLAAIYRETRSRAWSAFSMAWGVGLAYGLAVAFYQTATYAAHPMGTVTWLIILATVLLLVIGLLSRQSTDAVARPTMAS